MNYVTANVKQPSGTSVHSLTSENAWRDSAANPFSSVIVLLLQVILAEVIAAGIVLVLEPSSLLDALLINSAVLIVLLVPAIYILKVKGKNVQCKNYGETGNIRYNGVNGCDYTSEKTEMLRDGSEGADRASCDMMLQAKYDWEHTFNTLPDAITIHDRDFNIVRANKAAREVLGLPDILHDSALKCYKFYHSSDTPHEGCQSHKCIQNEEIMSFEIFEPHLERHLEIMTMPRYDNKGDFIGIIHIAKDISYKKETEQTIQDQIKRLSISNFIDKAIAANLNLNSILHILTDLIRRHLGIDAANVLLYSKESQVLKYVAGKGFRSDALKYTKLYLGESIAGRAAVERRTIFIPDLQKDPYGFVRSKHFASEGFMSYISVPLIAKDEVKGVLELFHRTTLDAEPEWIDFLDNIANQAAIAIDNAYMFEDLQQSKNELIRAYDSTIQGWSHALDMRDKETEGHSRRVAEMTVRIAKEIGIEGEELIHINRGAYLHDIGKMGIPDSILLKPGKLTAEEREIMELHALYARDMLKDIQYLQPAMDIPLYHHEKWNGTGYPRRLKGKDIPLAARIFAIVDVWDALSSDRPYRAAWPAEKVLEYMREESGIHFDPEMVEVFMKVLNKESEQ